MASWVEGGEFDTTYNPVVVVVLVVTKTGVFSPEFEAPEIHGAHFSIHNSIYARTFRSISGVGAHIRSATSLESRWFAVLRVGRRDRAAGQLFFACSPGLRPR